MRSPRLHPQLILASGLLSWVCGISVWMYSFVVIVKFLGWPAIFLIFLFNFISPIAAIALLLKGQWIESAAISGGLLLTYSMKIYSLRLAGLYEPDKIRKQRGEIIDIEADVEN